VRSCPQTLDQARSGDFPAITHEKVVAVGRVARYVGSSSPDSRGYDLDIRRTFSGTLPTDAIVLRVTEESPGLMPGQAVLLVAEPGPNGRVGIPGACVPLRPIDDAELLRWTRSL
jgi:hypothetical protein